MAQINKPSDYFNTVLYTGTGSELAITGVGFQPDWTWIKRRDAVANGGMFDNVRGATKLLSSSQTDGEQTLAQSLKSFDSDGFTLGTGTNGYVNTSGSTTVAWNWLASNTTASNTDGSITSTVSANTTSGFSIVSYTGNGSSTGSNVVGHGLGTTPSMIMIKARAGTNAVNNWYCWHKGLSANNNIQLNTTNAQFTTSFASAGIINTSPTSTTFGFDSGTSVLNINESGTTYIAYCFSEKKGFSKFGSYTGNGSTDGTFVYTGFKPAFIITKSYSNAEHWYMNDSKRSINGADKKLFPNLNSAESSEVNSDLLSNGFKLRANNAIHNASGQTYIYMAFAEEPLVGDNPATAR